MADEGGSVAMDELLMLFKDEQATRVLVRSPSFRQASLRSPPSKTGCGQGDSCFARTATAGKLSGCKKQKKRGRST
jgi:hypothetical protein